MELEGSLPCSQEPISAPYPEADDPVHILRTYFFKIHFNIIFQSLLIYLK
jgi:hypothetical protein